MIGLKIEGSVARLLVNRPDAANAFTSAMLDEFAEAISEAGRSADILLIRGEGDDFTVGRDRTEPKSGAPFDGFSKIDKVNRALASFSGITVAGVRGRAFGFGTGLTMRCDIAVGAADARFCLDEVKLGFPPMFIMEEILQHVHPKTAADLVLLSRELGAEEALAAGLLSRVAPAELFEELIDEMIEELASRPPHVLRVCKSYMRTVRELPNEARPAYALVEQTRFAMENH